MTRAKLRSILEDTQDLVISYDRGICVRYFNPAAARVYREFLGVDLEIGLCTYESFPEEARSYWDGINGRVLSGESFTAEYELRLPKGTLAIFETAYHPTWEAGEVTGFNTFTRDVTKQRLQEQRLRDHQKLESLGLLAGGVAHDFNNLLTAMLGNLNLAQRARDPNAASGYLHNIETAIVRASHLTRQLLAYARKPPLLLEPQDLSRVVSEMVRLLEASVSKKARIALALDHALPTIEADASLLQQVLVNLVTNAAEAIGNRPGNIRVATGIAQLDEAHLRTMTGGEGLRPGPFVWLEVEDDGCGMPHDVADRIFDPFFSTKGSGRGLGLSAMLGILAIHRGALSLSSDPGRGTTFRVFFPASDKALRAPAARVQADLAMSGTVLLADDDPEVLRVTEAALQQIGFDVVTARDGAEAVDRFHERRDELVLLLLDVAMPRLSGLEALAHIRGLGVTLPVVLYSGYADGADGIEIDPRAHTWFLQKPYSFDELRGILREAMSAG